MYGLTRKFEVESKRRCGEERRDYHRNGARSNFHVSQLKGSLIECSEHMYIHTLVSINLLGVHHLSRNQKAGRKYLVDTSI